MKLLAARIQNYRVHRDRSVDFAGNPTLLAGPNESGKSTLVEAIHRALFLKAKNAGEVVRAMRSDHGGHPEVEVTFETVAGRFTVRKRFAGQSGTTTLEEAGKPTLNGEEAEERLAAVLGVGEAISGRGAENELAQRWSHLWVRQGSSGTNPADNLQDHHEALVSRLQAMGGAGAIQSDLDRRVHDTLRAQLAELETDTGKPRAGTALHRLHDDLHKLQVAEAKAHEAVGQLESAVRQFEEAETLLAEKEPQLAANEAQLREAEEKQTRVQALRQEMAPWVDAITRCTEEIGKIRQHTQQIEDLSRTLPGLQQAVQSAEAALTAAQASGRESDEQATQREADLERAGKRLEKTQERRDDLLVWRDLVRARQQAAELKTQAKAAEKQAAEVQEKQAELARLPKVTPALLTKLRDLQDARVQAEADFKALATRVEVLAADASLRIQGKKAKPGSEASYSGAFEIEAGDGLKLRVIPGGGESVLQAQEALEEADREFRDALAQAESKDLREAESHLTLRSGVDTELKALKRALDQAGGDDIRNRLHKAEQNRAAAEARWERIPEERRAAVEAADEDAIHAALDAAESACNDIQVEISALKEARSQAVARQKEVTQALAAAQAARDDADRRREQAQVQLRTLEDAHGSAADRQSRTEALTRQIDELNARQRTVEQQLEELGADQLESQIAMLGKSVEQLGHQIQQARVDRAAAGARLQSAGTTDPQSDLAELRERREGLEARIRVERGRIDALRLLVQRFDAQVAALEQRFTQPLLDRVGGYLGIVFGTGTRAEARYQEGAFENLSLNRSAHGLGTHAFDNLSGGAKEQLGIAFRLAVAEIVAEAHGGCLPLVLDDAFVNSDPERVRKLQLMLHRAAGRGLQIILCTCTPSDYASLGAHEIRLPAPAPRSISAQSSDNEAEEGEQTDPIPHAADSAPAIPPQPGDEQAFLNALQAAGGSSGNIALRTALGWDEARYQAAKESLLTQARIQKGQGKGGTVKLTNSGN